MMTLAASLLIALAAPQGIVGPIGPVGPISFPPGPITFPQYFSFNVVGNPGFEATSLSPWQKGGTVKYYEPAPDGLSAKVVTQSNSGYVSTLGPHGDKQSFRMNAEFPLYVIPGNGISSITFVRQTLLIPIAGNLIANASVWVRSTMEEFKVTIEYTSGPPTSKSEYLSNQSWGRWDFRSAIDTSRTVKAIQFESNATYGPFSASFVTPASIDDVDVSFLTRIW